MKKLLFSIISLIISMSVYAQEKCGSGIDMEQIQKSDPKRYERIIGFNKFVEQTINNSNERVIDPNGTIIIPVVFHILYDGNEPPLFLNPTDARVKSQIDVLNEDFRRLNADRVNTPAPFQSVAADVKIEFRLACIDPNGNPTTGITRRDVGNKIFRRVAGDEFATGIKFTSQ